MDFHEERKLIVWGGVDSYAPSGRDKFIMDVKFITVLPVILGEVL